jgi:hypothetical protein
MWGKRRVVEGGQKSEAREKKRARGSLVCDAPRLRKKRIFRKKEYFERKLGFGAKAAIRGQT